MGGFQTIEPSPNHAIFKSKHDYKMQQQQLIKDCASLGRNGLTLYSILMPFFAMYLEILWKMEHLLQKSKSSIFQNIFKVFKT